MNDLEPVSETFLIHTARILLGTAYADGRSEGIEEDAILSILASTAGHDLPESVLEILEHFDPDTFDLEREANAILEEPATLRSMLLSMVAAVREADDILDPAEDEYILRLADALELEMDRLTHDLLSDDVLSLDGF